MANSTKDKLKVTENSTPGQTTSGNMERERLCQEGKCFYYKESGHRAFECDKKKQDAIQRMNAIKAVESGPEQAETGKGIP